MTEAQMRTAIEGAIDSGLLKRAGGYPSIYVGQNSKGIAVHVWNYPDPLIPIHILEDKFKLTPRQAEVARLLFDRRTNAEIAQALHVTLHTARRHVETVLLKLGTDSRFDVQDILVKLAAELH